MKSFAEAFGYAQESLAIAPGRVNMLGEHTDYNEGFVLPTPISQSTTVALAVSPDGVLRVESAQLPADHGFHRYVSGCCEVLRERGHRIAPVCVFVDSTVPIGAGLSSSAALEVATLRALRARFELSIDDTEIARLAQEAEIRFAGVNCGIMDQMASSLGSPGYLLFLDTRDLHSALIRFPENAALLILDSGTQRTLSNTAYNERRRECSAAARALALTSLRDVTDFGVLDALPFPLNRRARHVVTENARVLAVAAGVSARDFGAAMNASHASLRDDFEVSVASLDCLVALLQRHPQVFGARLTGAGFGGACVALVTPGYQESISQNVLDAYAAQGYRGARLG